MAYELAEYVDMIQPIDLPIEINILNIIIESDDDEALISKKFNKNESDILENNDTDISMAIQHASNHIKNLFQNDNQEKQSFVDSFNEDCVQLDLISKSNNNLSIINYGDSGKYFFFYLACIL